MNILFDGEILEESELHIGLDNRAFLYGDGVFESIRVFGGKIQLWEDHYFRLMSSMRISRMDIPEDFTPEYLASCIHQIVDSNDHQNSRVRITVYRSGTGKYRPIESKLHFLIQSEAFVGGLYDWNTKGLRIEIYPDQYKMSGVQAGIKSVSAQLYVMSAIYAHENDMDEAILLNENKCVIEGSSSNIFLWINDKVVTPPLSDGCVKGVMRKSLIDMLQKESIPFEEKSISPFELVKANEIWLTNTISGMRWVGNYRKKEYNSSKGEQVQQLLTNYINSKEDLWER